MKKVVALLLVAVMAIGFASCGKTAGGDVPTLVWYVPGDKQEDTALVNEEINKIIEPKIGAKIDIQFIAAADFTERLRLIMASQDVFDLCFTGWTNPYLDGVRRDGFYDMTDLIDKYGKDLEGVIPDYLWEAAEVDGRVYALPCYQAMTMCTAVCFNKEYVDKYNFDISTVKKYEDIKPFLEVIRDNEKGNIFPTDSILSAYFLPTPSPYEETSINYVYINRDTQEVVFQSDRPGYEEARQKAVEWRNAGFTNPDLSASTPYTSAACWVSNGYRPGVIEEMARSQGIEMVAVPLTGYTMPRSTATTTMTAISATTQDADKAMQFIVEANTNPDVFNLCAYGIEGKHYTKVDDKRIKVDPNSSYYPAGNWKFGNIFIGYLMDGDADTLWEDIQKVNDESTKNILLGFAADVSPVKTIISQLATVISEYAEIDNGTTLDLEGKTAEYEAKLEEAGKNELVEYAQKVIYEYLEEKGLR